MTHTVEKAATPMIVASCPGQSVRGFRGEHTVNTNRWPFPLYDTRMVQIIMVACYGSNTEGYLSAQKSLPPVFPHISSWCFISSFPREVIRPLRRVECIWKLRRRGTALELRNTFLELLHIASGPCCRIFYSNIGASRQAIQGATRGELDRRLSAAEKLGNGIFLPQNEGVQFLRLHMQNMDVVDLRVQPVQGHIFCIMCRDRPMDAPDDGCTIDIPHVQGRSLRENGGEIEGCNLHTIPLVNLHFHHHHHHHPSIISGCLSASE